jgi:hypothetical protein
VGLLRTFAVAGIAKKVFDEVRKPENQRKVKEAVAKVRSRGDEGGQGTSSRT